jgi:cellulose synthase/poly-beta-1,6-N-acetylglucosamine synthase-like glycosyltransferase
VASSTSSHGAPPVAVSVAMATYNGERYVEEQLRSILAQLRDGDEVVIVDDASADATVARIAALADRRVRVLHQASNAGVRGSFDRALRACRHPIIFLSDQDDLWLPDKRNALVAELQDGALLALSDASVIDAQGRVLEASFMARRGGFAGSAAATFHKNRYLGCTMAFRRELLDDVLPIPADVPMHDMWIGLLATVRGRVAYVDRPLMLYRRHAANVSPERRARLVTMIAWRWQLLRLMLQRKLRGPRPPGPEAAQ